MYVNPTQVCANPTQVCANPTQVSTPHVNGSRLHAAECMAAAAVASPAGGDGGVLFLVDKSRCVVRRLQLRDGRCEVLAGLGAAPPVVDEWVAAAAAAATADQAGVI